MGEIFSRISPLLQTSVGYLTKSISYKNEGDFRVEQGEYAKEMAEVNKGIHEENARIAEWEAQQALARSRFEVVRHKKDTEQRIANQVVAAAKCGFQLDPGSSAEKAIIDTGRQASIDQQLIEAEGAYAAHAYRTGAKQSIVKGAMAEHEGTQQYLAGKLGGITGKQRAGTSLLTGFSKLATQWSRGRNMGLYGPS